MTTEPTSLQAIHPPLRRLRQMALLEAWTLVLLIGVAVPLKHGAGWPVVVSFMGPVHGLAFVAYLWMALATVAARGWGARDAWRLLWGALLPLGGFFTARWLRDREARQGG
ncbi:MAG: DUF3817 domain-containing protein [Pseudomonadota bacterium]